MNQHDIHDMKEYESPKKNIEYHYGENPAKRLHIDVSDLKNLHHFDESIKPQNMDIFHDNGLSSIKREYSSIPSYMNAKLPSMPWCGSQLFNNETYLMNQSLGIYNMLQNNMMNNANFSSYPMKSPQMQNLMFRNMNPSNMNNLSLIYNKMMPKINMLPHIYKDNIMNNINNATQNMVLPRNRELNAFNPCGLYGNMIFNNNGVVEKQITIKQENL